jgi:hypothetical protein
MRACSLEEARCLHAWAFCQRGPGGLAALGRHHREVDVGSVTQRHTPPGHGAFGVEPSGLRKGADGFVMVECVRPGQALVEIALGSRRVGGDQPGVVAHTRKKLGGCLPVAIRAVELAARARKKDRRGQTGCEQSPSLHSVSPLHFLVLRMIRVLARMHCRRLRSRRNRWSGTSPMRTVWGAVRVFFPGLRPGARICRGRRYRFKRAARLPSWAGAGRFRRRPRADRSSPWRRMRRTWPPTG